MLKGKVHKLGANIDTDAIIAARYMTIADPAEMAKHFMEDTNPDFVKKIAPGDIIVATTNFGCGSSREHAPLVIKTAGISAVIAKSFARIFYRNSINIGLPLLESDEAVDNTKDGDTLEIDLAGGEINNLTSGRVFHAKPYPEFMAGIIAAGGLIEYTKQRLAGRRS